MLSPWSEDDIKKHQQFSEHLAKYASWSMTTNEMVEVYQHLAWFAQLRAKIRDSAVGEVKVYNPPEAPKPAPKSKSKPQ